MNNIMIIVESGNKIAAIEKYIQELKKQNLIPQANYMLDASVGHILELPKSWMPTKDETAWTPLKRPIRGKAKIINTLKAKAKKVDCVYVATDPDREGEAIAQDLVDQLNIKDKYRRMVFNEITQDSIQEALSDLALIDTDLVMAQKARLILDRMMGYKLSKWIQKKIWNANPRSAGRVQSPTLKLLVEREFAIEGFVPEAYIKIEQVINDDLIAPIVLTEHRIDHKSNYLNPEYLAAIKAKLTGELEVEDIKKSKKQGKTKIPFKQSAVYRAAASFYGMSAASARHAMQSLFEKGFISYPRTDSTRYANAFIQKTQAFILEKYGTQYVAPAIKGQAKGKQDAHEALRITDPHNTPNAVKTKLADQAEINMYNLIYNHTLATLMTPPLTESLSYVLDDHGIKFKLSSSKTIFAGYNIVKPDSEAKLELPTLTIGQKIKSVKINYIPGETNPPARLNEGSLIEQMELAGIGRPSTFSSTVSILQTRGYAIKKGNALIATRLGKAVALSLMTYFDGLIQEDYTQALETILDQIALGKKDYKDLLQSFWQKLLVELDEAFIKYKPDEATETQIIDLKVTDKVQHAPQLKQAAPEHYGFYSKSYLDVIATFTKYIKITKRDMQVNWAGFIKEAKELFRGPIMMPLPPKRGAYLINEDHKIEVFFKNKSYPHFPQCPVCQKNPLIYRGTVKKGRVSWFATCSGFPQVKCNFIENIDQKLQDQLELFYKNKVTEYQAEDKQKIIEYTQKLNLKDYDLAMTQTILLKELNKEN